MKVLVYVAILGLMGCADTQTSINQFKILDKWENEGLNQYVIYTNSKDSLDILEHARQIQANTKNNNKLVAIVFCTDSINHTSFDGPALKNAIRAYAIYSDAEGDGHYYLDIDPFKKF